MLRKKSAFICVPKNENRNPPMPSKEDKKGRGALKKGPPFCFSTAKHLCSALEPNFRHGGELAALGAYKP